MGPDYGKDVIIRSVGLEIDVSQWQPIYVSLYFPENKIKYVSLYFPQNE